MQSAAAKMSRANMSQAANCKWMMTGLLPSDTRKIDGFNLVSDNKHLVTIDNLDVLSRYMKDTICNET
jgi:hypothetical protein